MKSKEGHRFVQADAEPNLWSIMKGQGIDDDRDEWLVGFLLVYVDDLMVASDPTTTSTIIQVLQDEWETSEPEVVGQKKVKLVGMELTQAPQGGFRASQEDYILDKEGIPEGRSVKVPMTKDALPYPEEPTAEKITEAQKLVGEFMMWLSTRTRPDVSFATSRCAQEILTHPTWASEQAHLRLRAQHVRWRITNLDWRVRHLPGAIMIADLSTKPLPIQRKLELKELMSMAIQKKIEDKRRR